MASRYEALPGLSYLDFVKQLLPMWLLTPDALTPGQRELVTHGIPFGRNFLDTEVRLLLPSRRHFEQEQPAVLRSLHYLISQVILLREVTGDAWLKFDAKVRECLDSLGVEKKAVLHRLRLIVGQKQGLPAARMLLLLPVDYLQMLEYLLELRLRPEHDGAAGTTLLKDVPRRPDARAEQPRLPLSHPLPGA